MKNPSRRDVEGERRRSVTKYTTLFGREDGVESAGTQRARVAYRHVGWQGDPRRQGTTKAERIGFMARQREFETRRVASADERAEKCDGTES